MRESYLSALKSAVLWKGIDRCAALLKHVVIAGTIGLSAQLDVFYLTISLIGIIVFSWGGLIDVLAVPRLVTSQKEGKKESFDQLTGGFFVLSLSLGIILCIVLYVFRGMFSQIPFGLDGFRRSLLRDAFLWVLPVALLYIPLRFLGAVYRAKRQFSLFYQGEAVIALVGLGLVFFFRDFPRVLLWSFSCGVLSAFTYLLLQSRKKIRLFSSPFSHEVITVLKIVPGLVVLQGATYIYQFSDSIFVSFCPTGSVGALSYGWTLAAMIPSVFSLGGAFITVFSEKRVSGQSGENVFNDLVSLSLLLGITASFFLILHGGSLISILLERGVFTTQDTSATYKTLACYSLSLVPLFLLPSCVSIFQVINRIDLQVRRVIFGFFCNVVLNYVFLFHLGTGPWGIALATSLSYLLMLVVSLHAVNGQGIRINWSRHIHWSCYLILICIAASWICRIIFAYDNSLSIFLQIVFFGLIVFGGAIYCPLPESLLFKNYLRRIIKKAC